MKKNKRRFKEKYLKHLDNVWEVFKSPIVAIAEVVKNTIAVIVNVCVDEANNYDNWTKQMGGNKWTKRIKNQANN